MGRKNRKGRTSQQNARRFHRSKRERRKGSRNRHDSFDAGREESAAAAAVAGYEAALLDPTGSTIGALPRRDEWDTREIRREAETVSRTCGRCREWAPPRAGMAEAAARGECLHPGSGFSFPPAEMEACGFFH